MRLSHHYVVPHISTGDMLRAAVKTGSPLGLKVRETMENGELLGDELIIEMVADRVAALVEAHVPAKRYLVATDPDYRSRLSEVSLRTLAAQGVERWLARAD